MKGIFFLMLLFFSFQYVSAQESIKGKVIDKGESKPIENVSVVLLTADSILSKFTRTSENGAFELKDVKNGPYILILTYPKYEVLSKVIEVKDQPVQVDEIALSSQSLLIEEVVISQKIPIRIKGDTIEYNAGSFETEKNAKLEDLFRRLPGMTVSSDGTVTANGKTVSKVLIDGEEFFGYDPKIAIRNVRADAVDKVQVYERKSERAELTGIDDGERIQTVNVVLKEEAKKGIFGNVEGNFGTQELFDAGLFVAKFNQAERFGVTGNWNNMGNTGGGGRIRSNNQITGNPEYKSIGGNYENRLFQKRMRFTSNYNYNHNTNETERASYNKELLPDRIQESRGKSSNENSNKNHSFRAQSNFRIDSIRNLNINLNANFGNGTTSNQSERTTWKDTDFKLNDFEETNQSFSNRSSAGLRLDYRKRLNANGRNVNVHFNTNFSNNDSETRVNSTTDFYSGDVLDSTRVINQLRMSDNSNGNIEAQVNLSEQFFNRKLNVTLGYSIENSSRKDRTDAFNASSTTEFNQLDSAYSKNESNNVLQNGVNLSLNFNTEKWNINVSNNLSNRVQNLGDTYREIDLERSFWQNSLNSNAKFKISNSKSMQFSYQNRTTVPSFEQLQPFQPRTNELFQQLGNPNLKRAINNTYNLNYNSFKLLKSSNFNVNTSFNTTHNPIVNRTIIEDNGRRVSTFYNIADKVNWNLNGYAGYSQPIFSNFMVFSPSISSNLSKNFNFLNGELNETNSNTNRLNVGLEKQTLKTVDVEWRAFVGATTQKTSLQPQLNSTNLTTGTNATVKYYLPYKFNVMQVIHYNLTGKTKIYPNAIHQFYMNLELNKQLLKSQDLILSVKAFDIFNTFNNINRSLGDTDYSETQVEILTQYFMVGLKWDFNKNLGKKND